ncbi:MAG: type II secretion system F family protein [Candidatus Levybacteria bacterium]|nr:type II secretion system F family protein [Candidatus Levybacteria bacterium]MDZ4228199.1 type II secretion system F family protein [Candidatus Levybacteria bacterium]
MKLYYKAVTSKGESIEGSLEARDPSEAAAYLRSKELLPIKIVKKEKSKFENLISSFGGKIKSSEIVGLTRQLASMLSSGLTLLRSLEILKNQMNNHALVDIVDSIIKDVQEGSSFSRAIAKHPVAFSPVYVALIEASEGSGLLDKAFLRLADTLEKQQKLKNTVKGALTYPIIVIFMMVVVVFVMMIFVIPQISTLYQSMSVSLPWSTLILIQISNFFVSFWFIIIGFLVLVGYAYKRWYKTIEGKLTIDSMLLKIPIFGSLIKKTILAEFSRTLAALLASGTLVVESLDKVSNTTGNIHYKNAIVDISKRVEKGISIGDAMSMYNLFPPNLIELVKIGEQTGKLDETLFKASEYFENEVDQTVKTLSTALEPIILVVLGAGVAFLVFSIISPIYQITNSIQ